MKIIELFAGIGACSKALETLEIDLEIIDAVEIDKFAIASFNAMHNTNFGTQDIKTYNKKFNNIDLISHGSPCQDFSIAGKQAGGDIGSGTRSSLMYETIRVVGEIRPKYVLWENVKNLLSKKHRHNFDSYIEMMDKLDYNSYYQVLNAKDYNVPQNRERVYTVSIRKDIDNNTFKFPDKEELKIRLKDILEEAVEEKYYLKERGLKYINKRLGNYTQLIKSDTEVAHCPITALGNANWTGNMVLDDTNKCIKVGELDIKGQDNIKRVYATEGISPTLTNMQEGNRQPKILVKNATKQGYVEAFEGDSINLAYPNSRTRRGRVGKQVSQTLTTNSNIGVVTPGIKIRKLTPKECWRLMGFSDKDFYKAKSVGISDTQLYKQSRK